MILRKVPLKLIFFLIIAFIAGNIAFASNSRYGGTLIFGSFGEPLNLDPGVINDSESAQVASNIFETLVKYDASKDKFIPLLATSWNSSTDKKVWVFHLRKGVTFHDGTPFDARAVKFSWDRQRDINHPYHNPSYGRFVFYRSIWGGYPGNIKEIEVLDKYTIRVTLYARSPNFLHIISYLPFAIVSPDAIRKSGTKFTTHPVGTGPFKLIEWRRWQRIVLEKNPTYWGKKPYLDRLIFEPTPGEQSRHRQIRRCHIDMMEDPNTELINLIESGEVRHLKLYKEPSLNFSFLSLNCKKPPLDILLVRKAICFAINRKRILKTMGKGYTLANSPLDYIWGYKISGRGYPFNRGTAKALLKKAGFTDGFSMELWYLKMPRPFLLNSEKVAKEIAKDLRKVGIKVNVKGLKWETYLEKLRYGEHQAAITGIVGINYYPPIYFQTNWDRNNAVLGGTNLSFYRNSQIQNILYHINFSSNKKYKAKMYWKIQRIITQEATIVPLFHNYTYIVANKKVMGIQVDKNGIIDFSKIWLKR